MARISGANWTCCRWPTGIGSAGSGLTEYFADRHGCGIRVVNQPSLSPQAELVEDPVAVVRTFSCRLHGLRRYRRQIREAATDG